MASPAGVTKKYVAMPQSVWQLSRILGLPSRTCRKRESGVARLAGKKSSWTEAPVSAATAAARSPSV
jgi:hypothetical protein